MLLLYFMNPYIVIFMLLYLMMIKPTRRELLKLAVELPELPGAESARRLSIESNLWKFVGICGMEFYA
jgi:hypothetical protein